MIKDTDGSKSRPAMLFLLPPLFARTFASVIVVVLEMMLEQERGRVALFSIPLSLRFVVKDIVDELEIYED